MHIEIRHLRLVVAICETGSLTRAARRLNLTQSALSHQLRDVESRLGTPLFRRDDRRMVPTDAGQELYGVAQRVLAELDAAVASLATGERAMTTGSLRIATQCYTAYHWLPAIMRDYRSAWPGVSLSIVADATRAPHEAVSDGRVDVAIVYDHLDAGTLQYTPLFEDEVVVVVAPDHPFARLAMVHPCDLRGEHLILYDIPASSSLVQRDILGPENVTPRQVSRLPLTEAILQLVSAGLGISVITSWAVAPQVERGELVAVSLDSPGSRRRWSAARRIGGTHPHFESVFVTLLGTALFAQRRMGSPSALRLAR